MKMRSANLGLIFGLLTPLCAGAQTQETARLPYASVCRFVAADWRNQPEMTNQEIRLTIKSKLPGVKPSDLRVYIDSHPLRIPVSIEPDGTFSLPVSDKLLKENPYMVANQPPGTLELEAHITVQGNCRPSVQDASVNRQRYESLFSLLEGLQRQVVRVMAAPSTNRVLSSAVVVAYLIPRRNPVAAQVVIEAAKGAIDVPREANGTFRLVRDPLLARENPWVLMPTNHEWKVELRLEPQAEQGSGTLRR
jgi:hypothetical protein